MWQVPISDTKQFLQSSLWMMIEYQKRMCLVKNLARASLQNMSYHRVSLEGEYVPLFCHDEYRCQIDIFCVGKRSSVPRTCAPFVAKDWEHQHMSIMVHPLATIHAMVVLPDSPAKTESFV